MLVLAAGNRMRRRDEFEAATRRGRRVGRSCLTVYLFEPGSGDEPRNDGPAATMVPSGPRIGFVVGRGVGGAVTRNTVRRRLRHLMKDRLDELPADALVVIRALPPASSATSAVLAAELDAALERLLNKSVGSGPAYRGPSKGQRTVS